MLDIHKLRQDFPLLHQTVNGCELVYFDNAATSQKPNVVIDPQIEYYTKSNANVHRGNYDLSLESTRAYEQTRELIQKFLNASFSEEIIFTKGSTEAINLVAATLSRKMMDGRYFFQEGDEIIISEVEHHSNLVPWQVLALEKKLELKVIPVLANGELDYEAFEKLLSNRTKFVAISHVSNSLGIINNVKHVVDLAHSFGALVLVDGAQGVPHIQIDVQALDTDFYCFSGHKIFGPTGTGVLYGKKDILEKLSPYQFGGDMVDIVSFPDTTFNQLPYKFEAGTPNIAGIIGLGEAIKYVQNIRSSSLFALENYEQNLLQHLTTELRSIDTIRIIGEAENKIPIVSFVLKNIHPNDLGVYLGQKAICIRTGFHCAQPLMGKLGLENGTLRVSLAFYNTIEEIDYFIEVLKKGVELLK